MKQDRVAVLSHLNQSQTKHRKNKNDDLNSYDYDFIVRSGDEDGLVCAKEFFNQ